MPKTYHKNKSLTEKVLNYQMHRLKNKNDRSSHQMHESQQNLIDRYGQWRLPSVLGALGPIQVIESVKWLGYDPHSHIYSLLYCLLRGCTETSRSALKKGVGNQDYILLKYSMYKLASETLLQGEQKIIVELLSSAQYTNDISKFLCKYRSLERIFCSMYHSYMRRKKRLINNQKNIQAFLMKNKMEYLLDFVHEKFPFIGFKLFTNRENYPEEQVGIFVISQKKMYIIECNSCHFVAEAKLIEGLVETPTKRDLTKKIKAGIMYSKIEEESQDNEQFDDIDLGEKRNQSSDKRTSFGKNQRAQISTPKFNPNNNSFKDIRQKTNESSGKEKNITSFQEIAEEKQTKNKEYQERVSPQNSIGSTLVSIQSLLEKLKGKRFYKKDEKGQAFIERDGIVYKSLGFNSNSSLRQLHSKQKSYSLRKRRTCKIERGVKSIQKSRGSSPVSPPSGHFARPPYSPSHTTLCSPTRPSSNIFQSEVTSPVKGKRIVFTYALKK